MIFDFHWGCLVLLYEYTSLEWLPDKVNILGWWIYTGLKHRCPWWKSPPVILVLCGWSCFVNCFFSVWEGMLCLRRLAYLFLRSIFYMYCYSDFSFNLLFMSYYIFLCFVTLSLDIPLLNCLSRSVSNALTHNWSQLISLFLMLYSGHIYSFSTSTGN